jgi:hypothetical protein
VPSLRHLSVARLEEADDGVCCSGCRGAASLYERLRLSATASMPNDHPPSVENHHPQLAHTFPVVEPSSPPTPIPTAAAALQVAARIKPLSLVPQSSLNPAAAFPSTAVTTALTRPRLSGEWPSPPPRSCPPQSIPTDASTPVPDPTNAAAAAATSPPPWEPEPSPLGPSPAHSPRAAASVSPSAATTAIAAAAILTTEAAAAEAAREQEERDDMLGAMAVLQRQQSDTVRQLLRLRVEQLQLRIQQLDALSCLLDSEHLVRVLMASLAQRFGVI